MELGLLRGFERIRSEDERMGVQEGGRHGRGEAEGFLLVSCTWEWWRLILESN